MPIFWILYLVYSTSCYTNYYNSFFFSCNFFICFSSISILSCNLVHYYLICYFLRFAYWTFIWYLFWLASRYLISFLNCSFYYFILFALYYIKVLFIFSSSTFDRACSFYLSLIDKAEFNFFTYLFSYLVYWILLLCSCAICEYCFFKSFTMTPYS